MLNNEEIFRRFKYFLNTIIFKVFIIFFIFYKGAAPASISWWWILLGLLFMPTLSELLDDEHQKRIEK